MSKRMEKLNLFSEERFEYDGESDTYHCPAGQKLKPKSLPMSRQRRDNAAPKKICAACELREQCTRNKSGRTIKRHLKQEELDRMREASRSAKARRDIKKRQHLTSVPMPEGLGMDLTGHAGETFGACGYSNTWPLLSRTFKYC
ncbi:MAG TPA: transposase [Dehalococcoidales bacterium]|nr:transposase [Dehalococcoidales bacterium]